MRVAERLRRGRRLPARVAGVLVLALLAALPATPLAAQSEAPAVAPPEAPAAATGDLLERLEGDFRIVRLRSGVLLEPRVERGFVALEVGPDGVAVDGREVSDGELDGLLGASAGTVLELARLDDAARQALFADADAGALVTSATAAPVAPERPEPPARPERPRRPRRSHGDDSKVVVASELVVEEGEVTRDAVVFGGSLRVLGDVEGDAVAIGGSARVEGTVSGDLAVIGGSARLGPNAEIGGDAVAVGGRVVVEDGAEIYGEVVEVPFGPSFSFRGWDHGDWWQGWDRGHRTWFSPSPFDWGLKLVWKLFGFGLLFLFACLAALLARGPVDRIARRVRREPWKAGLVGLVAQILFFPLLVLVCLILLVSIIGIPLLLLVPFALLGALLVAFLGYVAVALRVGGWVGERFGWRLAAPYVVLLVGLVTIQIWSFIGDVLQSGGGPIWFFAIMFLVFGATLKYIVWTVGLGGALLTRFGTSESWERGALPPPPPPPSGVAAPAPEAAPAPAGEPFWEGEAEAAPEEPYAEPDAPPEAPEVDTRPVEPEDFDRGEPDETPR